MLDGHNGLKPPMPDAPHPTPARSFGPFVLDTAAASLLRDGQTVLLAPRPFGLLCHLLDHAQMLVTKDALLDAVWGHRHVSESVLKGTVNTLRAALGDDARAPQWIATVPRRGYRFIGVVRPVARAGVDSAAGAGMAGLADASRAVDGAATGAALAPVTNAGNLPAAGPALIGRDADLAALAGLMHGHRLVTLVGSGGIGKTRLALALATQRQGRGELPDGVWLVRLDALADSDALVATVARSLRLSAEAARSSDALAAALRTLRLLLVLDNCEHLLDAAALLVQTLLAQAPGLRLLVTSQEPLRMQAEQVWRVQPLACPPPGAAAQAEDYGAVALLLQRVRAQHPGFVLDASNRQAVCALCTGLDGLPLALELAAARVPLLGVAGVQARLQERLALLTQGPRDAAPRHRTLRAALDWSHALLTPDQRTVLRRLSVFAGSFSIDAAQAVARDADQPPWAVVDALGALVDKSLLVTVATAPSPTAPRRRQGEPASTVTTATVSTAPVTTAPVTAATVTSATVTTASATTLPAPSLRLRMFDSIRSFAAEQLAGADEAGASRSRHAHWMLGLLTEAGQQLHDQPILPWTHQLLPEVHNLRAALRHALVAEPALAVALFVHSVHFWHRAGLKHEAVRWAGAVRPAVHAGLPAALRAGYGQAQAVLCIFTLLVAPADAAPQLDEALRLHHALGDSVNEYFDLYLLWHLRLRIQPSTDHGDLWQRMLALEGPDWTPMRRRYARWLPALAMRSAGNTEGYRQFCIGEIAHHRRADDRKGVWTASYGLALAEHDRGHTALAIELLSATVQDMRDADCLRDHPNTVGVLASMLLAQDAASARQPLVREAVALLRVDGTLWCMASALPLGALWRQRPDDAARLQGWADAMLARLGERPGVFFGRLRAGCLARLQQAMAPADLQARCAEGALLDDDAALALAFMA